MPYFIDENNCVIEGTKEEPGETVKCHDTADEATAHLRALYANVEDASMSTQLLWIELQEDATKPVEFLRAGTFRDRHGQSVTITADDLDAYVANFDAGAAGQDVPIDEQHQRAEAFGWVKRVWREGERLLAEVDWNEIGRKLVGERVYRYLSASLDTANKVIKSVSLVNFPAIKGLRPVELSEGVYGLEVEPGLLERVLAAIRGAFVPEPQSINLSAQESAPSAQEATMGENDTPTTPEVDVEEVKAKVRAELEAELAEREAKLADLRAEVRAELEAEMTEELERRGKLREFAEEVCGGEHGISAKPEDVVTALIDLSEEAAEPIKALLRAKVVEFGERGTSREGQTGKKELPKRIVKEVKAGALTVADLENPILGLGDLNEYDLSELQVEE